MEQHSGKLRLPQWWANLLNRVCSARLYLCTLCFKSALLNSSTFWAQTGSYREHLSQLDLLTQPCPSSFDRWALAPRVLVSLPTPCSTNTSQPLFFPKAVHLRKWNPCAQRCSFSWTQTKADLAGQTLQPLPLQGGQEIHFSLLWLFSRCSVWHIQGLCLFVLQPDKQYSTKWGVNLLTHSSAVNGQRCFGPLKPSNFKANGNKCFGEN